MPDFMTKSEGFKRQLEEKQIIEPENIADAVVYALSTPPHVQVISINIQSFQQKLITFVCGYTLTNVECNAVPI